MGIVVVATTRVNVYRYSNIPEIGALERCVVEYGAVEIDADEVDVVQRAAVAPDRQKSDQAATYRTTTTMTTLNQQTQTNKKTIAIEPSREYRVVQTGTQHHSI